MVGNVLDCHGQAGRIVVQAHAEELAGGAALQDHGVSPDVRLLQLKGHAPGPLGVLILPDGTRTQRDLSINHQNPMINTFRDAC